MTLFDLFDLPPFTVNVAHFQNYSASYVVRLMSDQSSPGPRARSGVDSVAHTEHRGTSEGGDRTHADRRLSLDRSRMQDPRPMTHVEIPAEAPYTSGHSLEICLKNCHFLPHLGTPGVACRWQSSICKSIHANRIGPDICSPWPTKIPRGMKRPQKLPRLHTPVVHYLDLKSLAHRGGAHFTRAGRRHGSAPDRSAGESRTSGSRSTGTPGADVRNVHAVTPQSTFLNHAGKSAWFNAW